MASLCIHPAFLLVALAVMSATPLLAGHRLAAQDRVTVAAVLERAAVPYAHRHGQPRQALPTLGAECVPAQRSPEATQVLTAVHVRDGTGALPPPQG